MKSNVIIVLTIHKSQFNFNDIWFRRETKTDIQGLLTELDWKLFVNLEVRLLLIYVYFFACTGIQKSATPMAKQEISEIIVE